MSFCPCGLICTSYLDNLLCYVFFPLTDMISYLVWSESEDHKVFQAGRDLRTSAVQLLAQNKDSSEASLGCSGFIQLILKTSKNTNCSTSSGKLPVPEDVKAFSLFPVWTSPVQHSPTAPLWCDTSLCPQGPTAPQWSPPELPQPLLAGQLLPPLTLLVPLWWTSATPFLFWVSPCRILLNFIRAQFPILPGSPGPSAQQLCWG